MTDLLFCSRKPSPKTGLRQCGSVASGRLENRPHLRGMKTNFTAHGLEPLLSVAELAEYLGVPVTTIYDWRSHGLGPIGHRLGKHVKFAPSDVRAWLAERRDDATSLAPVAEVGGGAR